MRYKMEVGLVVIPAVIAAISSIYTASAVSSLQEKIQFYDSKLKALELYNKLTPNMSMSIGQKRVEIYYDFETSLDNLNLDDIEDSLSFVLDITEPERVENFFKEKVKSLTKTESTVISLLAIDYCVENKGESEQFVFLPELEFSDGNKSKIEIPERYRSKEIGGLGPKKMICSTVKIKYDDLRHRSNVPYKMKIRVEPTFRSLDFIYSESTPKNIRDKAQLFSYGLELADTI
ncbi:hypothetical protein Q3052_004830 [Vibrio parahaemolyticus]|nr:hypothetical protein [Vibrio parahaemolyticus]